MKHIVDIKAAEQVEIMKRSASCNLILCGQDKQYLRTCAFEIAAAWLGTDADKLMCSPDFRLIEAAEKDIRGAEQAVAIQEMAFYMPMGDKAVCIVLDAEMMTIDLQNKLLIALENCQSILSIIFVTEKPFIDTITSRCISIVFHRIPLERIYENVENPSIAALMACAGSPECYERILEDTAYLLYLEEFLKAFTGIKERKMLKNVLRLTHALKEKDAEYLPDKLENWQMQGFLCMLSQTFWYVLMVISGIAIPSWVKIGYLPELYTRGEVIAIYRKTEDGILRIQKKGGYTKNDFFELLMELIPVNEKKE